MTAKKSNATRYLIGALVLIILLAAGVFGLRAAGVIGNNEKGETVEVATVERRNVTQTVIASGKIQPEVEVKISPDVPGEIIALPIREGDQVSQGDLLVRIRQDNYRAQVQQAEASVLQSKAVRAQRRADQLNAELEYKRQKDLFEKQAVAESELQRAQTTFDVAVAAHEAAEYAVQSAEAQLRDTQEQLEKTTIYAPMSGTISMLEVELGERVVGTSQMAGTEMMRLAKLDQMEIEVDVNENDIVNVSILDSAAIEIDAYPGEIFRGLVTEIANSARVEGQGTQEQVTNFPVKIRVQDSHNLSSGSIGKGQGLSNEEVPIPEAEVPNFRPGMSGTVDIFTHTEFDALVVPIQSVTVRDINKAKKEPESESDEEEDKDQEEVETEEELFVEDLRIVVFVYDEGTARMVEVETGIADDTHIEIKSGLAEGDQVIIGPYRAVSRTLESDATVQLESDRRGPGGRPSFDANN